MNIKGINGIVLAGGKSSRMGTDKGLMQLHGKMFIEYILEALVPLVDSVLIIANNNSYDKFCYPVYPDIFKNCGPMGGIYSGLLNSDAMKNMVVSCDIPFITTQVLSAIISKSSDAEITIPEHDNKLEPLCAVYSKNCKDIFKELLEKKEWKMQDSMNYFIVNKVKFSPEKDIERNFMNINTYKEFTQLINN